MFSYQEIYEIKPIIKNIIDKIKEERLKIEKSTTMIKLISGTVTAISGLITAAVNTDINPVIAFFSIGAGVLISLIINLFTEIFRRETNEYKNDFQKTIQMEFGLAKYYYKSDYIKYEKEYKKLSEKEKKVLKNNFYELNEESLLKSILERKIKESKLEEIFKEKENILKFVNENLSSYNKKNVLRNIEKRFTKKEEDDKYIKNIEKLYKEHQINNEKIEVNTQTLIKKI